MRYAKQFGIPLSGYYAHEGNRDVGYGASIPLTGYRDVRGLVGKYDRKNETLYISFTVERSGAPLCPLSIPGLLEEAERVSSKETPRGSVHTAYTRTVPCGDEVLAAVPDVAEGVSPESPEYAPIGDSYQKSYLAVLVFPRELSLPGFEYQEPLFSFYRDGKLFYAYIEAQETATLIPMLGLVGENLKRFSPGKSAALAMAEETVHAFASEEHEEPLLEKFVSPSSPPEVEHLGVTADGTYAQRFRIGLQGYFDTIAHNIGYGYHTHGGRIPLNGYAVQGKPVVSFDPATEKLVIDFETTRTSEPLRAAPQAQSEYHNVEPVPDISVGLSPSDTEYAPGTAEVAHQQFALLVSEHKMEGRDLGAFSSLGRKPVLTFTHGGKTHYVYLEVQVRSYENGIYDHEYRIPLEDIKQHQDGHEMWVAGHEPVFQGFEEIDPSSISVRLSSNRKKIVVNAGLRRSGDFEFCKREFKDAAIGQVKRGSIEARDHGEEPEYGLSDWEGAADFHEIIGIVFSFMPVAEYDNMSEAEVSAWLERNYGDGVFVGTAGDYAVFAAFHID